MIKQEEDRMSKHTPGPWTIICSGPDSRPYYIESQGAPERGHIAHVYEKENTGEHAANAAIIAAAPELFEALKVFKRDYEDALNDFDPQTYEVALAAIAHAEGRSK